MSVEDHRQDDKLPYHIAEAVYGQQRYNMTQSEKDAWVQRLESAESVKALGVLQADNGAACALGHLAQVAPGLTYVPTELYNDIVRLNDVEQLSLPEIAVWVKENVDAE